MTKYDSVIMKLIGNYNKKHRTIIIIRGVTYAYFYVRKHRLLQTSDKIDIFA